MSKLYIEKGPLAGKTFVIARRKPFLIGRSESAQIVLSDTLVSRRHCQIEIKGEQFFARDLGSINGTFINGRRITFATLYNNDHLRIGETVFIFQSETKDDSLLNTTLGGYRINALIGRGGMGTVYRAKQISLGRQVAFKVLSPELAKDKDFVKLFLNEARSAAALDHPNIVKVYEVGSVSGIHFFSMEFIPGGSVEEKLSCGGNLPIKECLRIAKQAAEGLSYVASKNLVHRDIKPGNLLLNLDGTVKICDLGIAGSIDIAGEDSFRGGGSPHFIAPEQALGKKVDSRADIYSLGISLYTLLAGHTPFTGSSSREIARKHVKEAPQALSDQREGLPPEVCALVHWMIKKDPMDRPSSASVVVNRLDKILGGKCRTHLRREKRSLKPVFGTVVVLVLAIAFGIFMANQYLQQKKESLWQGQISDIRNRVDQYFKEHNYLTAKENLILFMKNNNGKEGLSWIPDKIKLAEQLEKKYQLGLKEIEAEKTLTKLIQSNAETTAFESFVRDYQSTSAAKKASIIIARKQKISENKKQLEDQADKEFKRVVGESNDYLKKSNFLLAYDILELFPVMFSKSKAYKKIQDQKNGILEKAKSHMKTEIEKAFKLAEKADAIGAQQILNQLKLPKSFNSQVNKARSMVLEIARKSKERKIMAARAADLEIINNLQGSIAHLVRECKFREVKYKLNSIVSSLKSPDLIEKVRNRITRFDQLYDFFNSVCHERPSNLFEFSLDGKQTVWINRLLSTSVEFYRQKEGEKRAQRIAWSKLKPERLVALLTVLAKTDLEKKACSGLAIELGVKGAHKIKSTF